MAKSKYILFRQDWYGGTYGDHSRIYGQNTLTEARIRACKMIHRTMDTVYIFDRNIPEGYVQWVKYDRNIGQYFLVDERRLVNPVNGRLFGEY